jgi:hypothetical protein
MSVFRAAQRERLIGQFSVFTDRLEQIRDSLLLLLESLAYGVFYHSALKINRLLPRRWSFNSVTSLSTERIS